MWGCIIGVVVCVCVYMLLLFDVVVRFVCDVLRSAAWLACLCVFVRVCVWCVCAWCLLLFNMCLCGLSVMYCVVLYGLLRCVCLCVCLCVMCVFVCAACYVV